VAPRRLTECDRLEPDLLATAAGEVQPEVAERVEGHVRACASCRDDLRDYRAIEGALGEVRSAEPRAHSGEVAASRERLESRLLDARSRILGYRVVPSPFGDILIARSELGIALIEYLDRVSSRDLHRLAEREGIELVEGGREIDALGHELVDYLGGRLSRLPWPLDFRLARSPFQRAVMEKTAGIPRGAVVSYTHLARDLGRPRAVRAVAQALRHNPLPIVVPCHRVIGASGSLVGYAGGETGRKERLLTLEGVPVVRGPRDYEINRDRMYVLMPGDREYCLPTCPSPEAVATRAPTFFASRQQAEAVGLEPCTTCRPDLHALAG
jgi:O-6-methylguanine DNA methyltransferase